MQQYVPLFLAKEDLDVAVSSAYRQRNATQIKLYRDKVDKAEDEYNQVGTCVWCQRPACLVDPDCGRDGVDRQRVGSTTCYSTVTRLNPDPFRVWLPLWAWLGRGAARNEGWDPSPCMRRPEPVSAVQ